MYQVKTITYVQFCGMLDDDDYIEEDECYIDEFETEEEAMNFVEKVRYGHFGQLVEVYLNNRLVREYERC